MVQSKFHKNVANVTFICKKSNTSQQNREAVHKFSQFAYQDTDKLFEELLEAVDPAQTNLINNLEQELEKINNKCRIQEKIILDRLLEGTTKSFNDIAKNGDFLQNIYDSVNNVEEKLKEAKRLRLEPYAAYFKYSLILKDLKPILKKNLPYFRIGKTRIKTIILNSIKYNSPIENDGEIIEP